MELPYVLLTTKYGGRGLFSTTAIPKGTLLHTCPTPYATVIFRDFRKEVCAQCFSYAFDAQRNAWNVRLQDNSEGSGVWFCREACRDLWLREQNEDGLQTMMNQIVENLSRQKKLPDDMASVPKPSVPLRSEQITPEFVDQAWKMAEEAPLIKLGSKGGQFLNDLELNTARFIITAIIRRHFEDSRQQKTGSQPSTSVQSTFTNDAPLPPPLSWDALLELQENEVTYLRAHPHRLTTHLKIYAFLRKAVVPVLQPYVRTSETVRAIVARDHCNVFGLWDMSTTGDSEMLGWNMYVSGSYFNHDCSPNVRKERLGRALRFVTTRDVAQGEELCINYIDIKDKVDERRDQLRNTWYFECGCKRCEEELVAVTPLVGCVA